MINYISLCIDVIINMKLKFYVITLSLYYISDHLSGVRTFVSPPGCHHTVDPVQGCRDPTVNPWCGGQGTADAPGDDSDLGVISASALRVDQRSSGVSLTRVLSEYIGELVQLRTQEKDVDTLPVAAAQIMLSVIWSGR